MIEAARGCDVRGLPVALLLLAPIVAGWSNGPSGNTRTDTARECSDPPYASHDWVADHARALLPDDERAWMEPHRTLYLLGTEAPDHDEIPASCRAPGVGYDDGGPDHNVEWNSNASSLRQDGAARRAREEYAKAVAAFRAGSEADAAYYLGAMSHYVGDLCQYGHTYPDEAVHAEYERWARLRMDRFNAGHFETAIVAADLVRRAPYAAAERAARIAFLGGDAILPATAMDAKWTDKDAAYHASVAASLNVCVNEIAHVLHTFFLDVVSGSDQSRPPRVAPVDPAATRPPHG